uniref:Uncharacterized protein n=1 Tax=Arundo donax TaxID=35708 RepID=A0A0A9F1L3_ARUDO
MSMVLAATKAPVPMTMKVATTGLVLMTMAVVPADITNPAATTTTVDTRAPTPTIMVAVVATSPAPMT